MSESKIIGRSKLAHRLIERRLVRSKEAANQIIEVLLDAMIEAIRAERVIQLNGFGTFKVVPTGARQMSKHITTGEPFVLTASRRVRFIANRQLLKGTAPLTPSSPTT